MSIQGYDESNFSAILGIYLTPSSSIKTPERLFGRQKQLTQIQRALASDGRQAIVHGDRGVGKTSLAQTAAYLINSSSSSPIYVPCGESDTFGDVILALARRSIPAEKTIETSASGGGASLNLFGTGGGFQNKTNAKIDFQRPENVNQALEIVRYISNKSEGIRVAVIDEMERMANVEERKKFAEFIKNLSETGGNTKFIFCGIGRTVEELIGAHPSAGRVLESIPLPRLHHDELWEIVKTVASKIGVEIDREMLIRIGQLSDGFPHYVHLVAESILWSAFDDTEKIEKLQIRHFKEGISVALGRAESTLKQQYDKATLKSRLTIDYEESLWALADTTSDKRQLKEVFESSYKRIASNHTNKKILSKEELNQRLLTLRKDSHGSVVTGFGSGWFGFRENILRGYIRLKAENSGVILGRNI